LHEFLCDFGLLVFVYKAAHEFSSLLFVWLIVASSWLFLHFVTAMHINLSGKHKFKLILLKNKKERVFMTFEYRCMDNFSLHKHAT
jgi:hypothetical protein